MPYFSTLAAGAYYFFNVPGKSTPCGRSSRSRSEFGRATVFNQRFRLRDHSRATPAYRGNPARPCRDLPGELWRPLVKTAGRPLVIYNHGFMSYRREALYLAKFLASHGYNVAALDFPLTGRRAAGKPHAPDIVNQPGDISALIDYLLARNSDPDDSLYGSIDPNRIALVGLSFGALTSLLATYHRDWRDSRIGAVIAIAGPTSMLSADFFRDNTTPALLVYGDSDSIVHYDDHALPAFDAIQDATLVRLQRASHTGFAQPASTVMRLMKNPDSLACSMLRRNIDKRPWDFVADLGGSAVGVVEPEEDIAPLTKPLVPVAMKAARQHMFTNLATHAFLESRFASSASARQRAERFLHRTLQRENAGEVGVLRG